MRIAVLGGGNGSFAAAGDFTLGGHHVRLWRRDRQAVAAQRMSGGVIVVKDFRGRHEAKPALVTDDMAAAVRGAELIVCPAPAAAQADIARLLAPHLTKGQVVFLPPGTFGSFVFAKAAHKAGTDVAFAETGTLPWLTRKHGAFEVAITIRAKRLPTGVLPLRLAVHAHAVIGAAFPDVIEPCGDVTRKAPNPQCAASLMRSTPSASPCARPSATVRRTFHSPTTMLARARSGCTAAARTTSLQTQATGASSQSIAICSRM